MDRTGVAGQRGGIAEKGGAVFAAAVGAVRREFFLRGNIGEYDATNLHVSSKRQYAAFHGRKDPSGGCAGGPGDPKAGGAKERFAEPDCVGREDGAAQPEFGAE